VNDDVKLVVEICKGNKDAEAFLHSYRLAAHQIDDVIDPPPVTTEFISRTFMAVVTLFGTNQFYCDNRAFLYPLIITGLNCYATSVEWEKSSQLHHQRMADMLRSSGNMVLMFVALMCGGVEHMREMTPIILELSWKLHHDKDGNPT
jgi:hypothetical protein